MHEASRNGRAVRLRAWAATPLLVVLLTGFAVRIAALIAMRDDLSIRVPLLDARHYIDTATALAQGGGWPPGPHFMSPIYPFLLSGLFRLAPPTTLVVQWAQLILGLGTVAFVTLAAGRHSVLAGWIAGLLYALCGPAIAYENHVLMEPLIAFSLALLIWLGSTEERPGPARLAAVGLAIGVAAAGRPTYLLLLPLAWLVMARRERERQPSPASVAAMAIGVALVILPPTIHNVRATGRWSPVTTSGGLNLYIGNHAQASGIYSLPPGLFLEKDPTATRSASRLAGRQLTPAQASSYYAGLAWNWMVSNPIPTAKLWLRKAGYMMGPDEVPQIESFDTIRRDHLVFRWIGWIGFPLYLLLAALGLRPGHRNPTLRRLTIAVLIAGAAAHLIFFSTGRYRAAMLPAMAILAGMGGRSLVERLRGEPARAIGLWPMLIPLLILMVAPRIDSRAAQAWSRHQDGIRYEMLGDFREATKAYRAALAADSTQGESWHNLAACEVRAELLEEAAVHYRASLRHLGENPVTLANLAVVYGRLGQDARALEHFDRAVAADPADLAVRVDRGVALYRLGRLPEAFAAWREVGSENPSEPSLTHTLVRLRAGGVELPPDLVRLARPE